MTRGTRGLGSKIQGETNDECHMRFVNEDSKDACCKVIPCEICMTFTDDTGVEFKGIAKISPLVLGQGNGDLVWTGEVGDYEIRFILYGEGGYGSECSLHIQNMSASPVDLIFSAEQCVSGNNCIPTGEASFQGGTIEWETNKYQRREVIFPDNSCDSVCEECRCICNKVCLVWEVVIDPTDFECYCAPYYEQVEYDCDENSWSSIFEPACPDAYGGSEVHTFDLRLDNSSGACYLVLEVDGIVRNSVLADAGSCREPSIGANYIDDEGRTISVSVNCSECATCMAEACEIGCCFLGRDAGGPTGLTYTINAPNCPDIDGLTGTAPPLDWDEAPCGFCACMDVIPTSGSFNIQGTTCLPGGFNTPCSVTLHFIVSCNRELDIIQSAPILLNDCCSRMLLLADVQGVNHTYEPSGALSVECDSFIDAKYYIRASSCECDCQEGLDVTFPLDQISLGCNQPTYGDCYGLPTNCCDPTDCSLSGATIVFTTP